MPHLTVEYTRNLPHFDGDGILHALNRTLIASGLFDESDIKSRAVRLDTFLVGAGAHEQAFVHVRLALLNGRDEAVRAALSQQLLQTLQRSGAWPAEMPVQLCVEIQEIEHACYAKTRIDAQAG